MVEVIENRSAVDKFAGSAQMVKAGAEVRVLPEPPTFVLLVPAVDFEEIFFPHGHVAADDAALGGVTMDNGKGEAKGFGGAGELTREEETKTWHGFACLDGSRCGGV